MLATSDYELVTEGVGLVDRSDRAKFVVRGGEAAEFLQGQVSNEVVELARGSGCYSTILTAKGKLRTDLRILRSDDFFWLDTEAVGHAVLRHMLQTYSVGRDVQWEDATADHAILSLIGPQADGLAEPPPAAAEHSLTDTGEGLWVRTDLGLDLLVNAAKADEWRDRLGVEPVSLEAAECVRIESGRPRLGYDMDAETMPQEAGINDRAVSFTKGCYVGQETVARLHYRGKPNRRLLGLRLSEPAPPGTELQLGEKVVGKLGSVVVSPDHGPIALALVRREANPGDTVDLAGSTALIVDVPFAR